MSYVEGETRLRSKRDKILFQENGSLLLEKLFASSGGQYNPIRTFSSHQILQATNHFDSNYIIFEDVSVWYKGMIEERRVVIKARSFELGESFNIFGESFSIFRDIAVSSMMSSHKNVLKFLRCCLEFTNLVLVFEYAENRPLSDIGRVREGVQPFPWNIRLKITKEISSVVTYLHTEFPKTIIHRDLKLEHIFLDDNWTAKLSGFSLSRQIPEGETSVNDRVCGTRSYVEPSYGNTGVVTTNVDVYSFGIVMLILLTEETRYTYDANDPPWSRYFKRLLEQGSFNKQLLDQSLLNDASDDCLRLQMEAFYELALRC